MKSKIIAKWQFLCEEYGRLFSNFVSLALLQGANYVLPLLTLPYLVQVLGAERFGLVSFAQALAGFFIILTDYGFNLSATKEISIHKDNPKKVSEIFSTVLLIKVAFLFIGFLLYYLIVQAVETNSDYNLVYYLSYGVVVGQVLFPSWFFQGIQKMKYITFINIASKTIFTVLIFIFIHKPSDFLYVPLTTSIGHIIGGVIALIVCFKTFQIELSVPLIKNIRLEIKNGFSLFLTSVSSNIISSSSVFVLGLYSSKEVVGYFSAIEKLSKVFVSAFSPVTQAIFPHVSHQFSISKENGKRIVFKFGKYIMAFALLVVVFIILFHAPLVELVYGKEFASHAFLLIYFGIWLFFGVLNNFIGVQFLVGSGNSKTYSKAFAIASSCTLLAFIFFVKQFSVIGIIGGILVGEIVLTVLMLLFIRRLNLLK